MGGVAKSVAKAAAAVIGAAAIASGFGAPFVWSTVLASAAVNGALAGLAASRAQRFKAGGRRRSDVTLNTIQPVTEGVILYGERMLGGAIVARSTSPASGSTNGRYHSVLTLACHEIADVLEIWIGDRLVWTRAQYYIDQAAGTLAAHKRGLIDTPYRDTAGFIVRYGTDTQSGISHYTDNVPEWTAQARGRGIAYLYFTYVYSASYRQGTPQIRARVKGKPIYDPRTDAIAWSANPALHFLDYATTPESRGGGGWTLEDVDLAAIIALANVCDEPVPLEAGGTQARYEYNGVLDTALEPRENFDRLASAWGGWWTAERGLLTVGGGAYDPPSLDITPDMMVATMQTQARRPFEEQVNRVLAVYSPAAEAFVQTDLPVLASSLYRGEDAGRELTLDLGEMAGETDMVRGQRLMKLALLKARRQISAVVVCDLSAMDVRLGDTVTVTAPWRGWDVKPFEVVGQRIEIGPGDGERSNCHVELSLIETGPAVYDWTTSEEYAGLIPVRSNLPGRYDPAEVDAPSVTEVLYEARSGGVRLRVELRSATSNPFVRTWQFGYYPAAGDPSDVVTTPSSEDPTASLVDFTPGAWVFGVRATTEYGIVSDWVWGAALQVLGLGAAPEAVPDLHIQPSGTVAILKWTQHPALDVRQGGRIEFRHSSLMSSATWSTSRSIGRAVAGMATETSLPLLPGTYLARAVDAQGISGPPAMVVTRAPALVGQTLVTQIAEQPAFSGMKSGCSVSGGALTLDPGNLEAVYEFGSIIDLGSVQKVRLVTLAALVIASRADLFWEPSTEPMWTGAALFWTGDDAEGDVVIEVSGTDDNPAGSPVWTAYAPLHAADMQGRAFRFRARLTAETTEFEVTVGDLSVSAYQ